MLKELRQNEQGLRISIVEEARRWIGTPYVTRGRVPGAGCDCGSFLLSVAVNCGLMDDQDLEIYSADCWLHWSDEHYRDQIIRFADQLMEGVAYRSTEILPGCFMLTRSNASRKFNHGGIVTEWPMLVHATLPHVMEVDATTHSLWAYRPVVIYDFLGKNENR